MRFPGRSSEVIELFLFWAYRNKLSDFTAREEDDDTDYYDTMTAHTKLARVWLFGDAYDLPKLQNAAMKQIVKLTEFQHTSPEMIQLCWESTTDAVNFRPLRQFAVAEARHEFFNDSCSLDLTPQEMEDVGKKPGLLAEILELPKGLLRGRGSVSVDDFGSAWKAGWQKYAVVED